MARKREYEHLAKLKTQKKEVEEEIKKVQENILLHSPKEEAETKYGTLKLRVREDYSVTDNNALISKSSLTKQIFINAAKLAPSSIKKIVGETEFDSLVKAKTIKWGGQTEYYVLEAPKKNQEQL